MKPRPDASDLLGAAQLMGTYVSPKREPMRLSAAAGRRTIRGAGRAVQRNAATNQRAPRFGMVGFVVVTGEDVALVRARMGMLTPRLGTEVLARVPRRQVAEAAFDKGLTKSMLRIAFAPYGLWEFEIPRAEREFAAQVAAALSEPAR